MFTPRILFQSVYLNDKIKRFYYNTALESKTENHFQIQASKPCNNLKLEFGLQVK